MDIFGPEIVRLGSYASCSRTVQLPWAALNERFGATLRALGSEPPEEAPCAPPKVFGGSGYTCSSCNWEGANLVELKRHCNSSDHVKTIRRQAVGKSEDSDDDDDSESDSEDEWTLDIGDTKATRWRRRLIDRVVFWERPKVLEEKFGVAICSALMDGANDEELNASARRLLDGSEKYWIVVCLRSGRFAGAVFDAATGQNIVHKTIKKYTIRAKSGGAQAAQDSTGRKPKSAGSSLRRHGEQRLEEEITSLFEKWKPYLPLARLFASASPRQQPLLTKLAGPSSRIPFMASKVSFEQVECLFSQLRAIHVTLPQECTVGAAQTKSKPIAKEVPVKQAEAVKAVPVECEDEDDPQFTDLHRAARDGNCAAVPWLLETIDPTQRDTRGRVPYFLCANAATRDAFRRFCGTNGDRWDWVGAHVEALTDEMEEKKKQKARDKRKRQKERQKEHKEEKRREEEEMEDRKRQEEEARRGPPCESCGKRCGKKPFYRLYSAYCSTECVQTHKRSLAVNAALARFNQ